MDLNFSNIRTFEGSQENAFEELVCQLAHLSPPKHARRFIRKEGAGGDAGVECYWELADGSEHCWQAKFFVEALTEVQWAQISKSVKVALEKHPKLTKYYICLPRDWTDSRKKSRSGKKVKSAWDKWVSYVSEWKKLASDKGMGVEFTYWCKHEICQMLQVDDPKYSGKALYWFNKAVLRLEKLHDIANKTKTTLGDRFTPEFHVDLPIAQEFGGIGNEPTWRTQLQAYAESCRNCLTNLENKIFINPLVDQNVEKWCELKKLLTDFTEEFESAVNRMEIAEKFEELIKKSSKIKEVFSECRRLVYALDNGNDDEKFRSKYRNLNTGLFEVDDVLQDIVSFLNSRAFQLFVYKSGLLLGEAGIGKSHLLCDVTLKRLDKSLPTLFLVGQHYSGGNPLIYIREALDLPQVSFSEILGALDALGEARQSNVLFIIDAINEGSARHDWYDHLSDFLYEIGKYENLAILLSCRSTYEEYIVPDNIDKTRMVKFHHWGFRGHERQAAKMYLEKNGLTQLSSPLLLPEFSNPLFLKTCCQALKRNNEKQFPKGLRGATRLFSYYMDSIEKSIRLQKRYTARSNVVGKVVSKFVDLLYPKNLYGIPVDEAQDLINREDRNSNIDRSLFDLLIDEGLLSLDIKPEPDVERKGVEVVRFTYERFSDFMVAENLIKSFTEDNIHTCFDSENPIGEMLSKEYSPYEFAGIIEALGICIPEKFQKEFVDLMVEKPHDDHWVFDTTFTNTLLWRSPESITERSLELLNDIRSYPPHQQSLDILISLSTEPNHPWNAEFLDKNLLRKKMPERDAFWSTHVAVSDSNDEDREAPLRLLIDWAINVKLGYVELERLRLAAIVLSWTLSTTNRKVRDQATKSLSRILSLIPEYVPDLIKRFSEVDDPYVIERFYAALYGAIFRYNNTGLKEISNVVYETVFSSGSPYPHILLRDYARGIMEFADYKELLSSEINPELFRPPYNSSWPIENPSKGEIEKLAGDKYSSRIKSSLMGFPGDFGNYTMGRVHDWSPTQLSEPAAETSYEIQKKFAETLPEKAKQIYLSILEQGINGWRDRSVNQFVRVVFEAEDKPEEEAEASKTPREMLDEMMKEILSDEQKEYYRWAKGLGIDDNPASFSRKWAQRWVCKRAYEFGWNEELFDDFEKNYSRDHDRSRVHIERIGKKYQWIAFHELLARMSDNLLWIDKGYSDCAETTYCGPWQIYKRDIDPTFWQRKTSSKVYVDKKITPWWQPHKPSFAGKLISEQVEWIWKKDDLPKFTELLKIKKPENLQDWLVLHGFYIANKKVSVKDISGPTQDFWFRINSCLVHKDDVAKLRANVKDKNLCDPSILSPASTGHELFLKEYPWHLAFEGYENQHTPENLINVPYLNPVNKYEWESGSKDNSIDESVSIYLPSKELIDKLNISMSSNNVGQWIDESDSQIFIDPSVNETGPTYALINMEIFKQYLEKNNLILVWLVGGEKYLLKASLHEFHGRLVYSGMYVLNGDSVEGDMWYIEEEGNITSE